MRTLRNLNVASMVSRCTVLVSASDKGTSSARVARRELLIALHSARFYRMGLHTVDVSELRGISFFFKDSSAGDVWQ